MQSIERVIDTGDLSSGPAEQVERNAVAEVVLRTRGLLALDEHRANPSTGRFVLVEDFVPVGGGIISMEGYPDQRELVTRRATNITAVGHTVIARGARAAQRPQGRRPVVHRPVGLGQVDHRAGARGAAVRQGLPRLRARRRQRARGPERQSRLLARGPRREHPPGRRGRGAVRGCRASSSSARSSRPTAPIASGPARPAGGSFHEIYIQAPIEVCEQRDPKGLYRRARTGEIPEFTGVSSPYEPPESAELVVRTDLMSVEECLSELAAYVERAFAPES